MITDKMIEAALDAWWEDRVWRYDCDINYFIKLMRAALEAADAAAWQPIETAPCDGTTVLVYAPSPDPQRWHESVHDLPHIFCTAAYHEDAGFCIDTIREPTHWRSLPAAPKKTT